MKQETFLHMGQQSNRMRGIFTHGGNKIMKQETFLHMGQQNKIMKQEAFSHMGQ
jgi:hypothetical protein